MKTTDLSIIGSPGFRSGAVNRIIAVFLFVLALFVSGCDVLDLLNTEDSSGSESGVFRENGAFTVFSPVEAEQGVTTTQLDLVFSADIPELTVNDITVTGLAGVTATGLFKTDRTGIYTLVLDGVSTNGTVTVTVNKNDCRIEPASRTTPVYYVRPVVETKFLYLAADGTAATVTTTHLTLVFDKPVSGLTANDITITDAGSTGAVKGVLAHTEGAIYTLEIGDIMTAGQITIDVRRNGYTITPINPATRTVSVHYASQSSLTTFSYLAADGTANVATTTHLTLTFNKTVSGLTADDITVTGLAGLTKGTLSLSGTTYTLPVSGFTAAATVTVAVNKSGYTFSPAVRTVPVHYVGQGSSVIHAGFQYLAANGTATTAWWTLTFDKPVSGLTADDITVAGLTGLTKGTLDQSGTTTYTLPVSGFTVSGTVTVTVNKSGYSFNPAYRTAQAHYVTSVAFSGVTANGTTSATTTQLTLAFDKPVSGLIADNITITGLSGLTKGTLSQSGATTYILPVSDFTAAGTVTVTVNKSGYGFNPASRTVQVHYVAHLAFSGVTANGTANAATTTQLTLAFDKPVSGLTANDITVTGLDGLTKGTPSQSGATTYILPVSGFTAAGTVTVTVGKSGYSFNPAYRTVQVHYVTSVTFSGVTANGAASTTTTTQLTLAFDKPVSGLSANDITITGLSGLEKGTLGQSGATTYILPVSGFTAAGTVTVTVNKSGYGFNPAYRTVQVHYATPITQVVFSGVTANGAANTTTTTELTLAFDRSVSGLTANDITVTGPAGITKGTFGLNGATYTLQVSGFTTSGTVTVAVSKSGYSFTPVSQTVQVYYVAQVTFSGVTANGAANTSTTQLTLDFDTPVSGLTANDITITGLSGLEKGALSQSGTTYILPIGGFTASGTVTVAVNKSGYRFNPASQTVQVYYAVTQVTFSGVTANGTASTTTTTELTLAFDTPVSGLAASDITITGLSGITKGTLTQSGTTYTLRISGLTEAGTVTVTVSKSGYSFSPASQAVQVHYYPAVGNSIKEAFGISSTGTAGVSEAFYALHNFIQNGGLVSEPNKIKLGDWIDLEGGLTVEAYPGIDQNGGGGFSAENLDVVPSDGLPFAGYVGKTLRLIVVGINAFKGRGAYINLPSPDHVAFQFQNLPVERRMNPDCFSYGRYLQSEMRTYLTGNFLTGLKNAGVPESVLWATMRLVSSPTANPKHTLTVISDLLWLPSEFEMLGQHYLADTVETPATQGLFPYYPAAFNLLPQQTMENNSYRRKYMGTGTPYSYWASSAWAGTALWCFVLASGDENVPGFTTTRGVAPAFCVK
jgi:hypothetical protein